MTNEITQSESRLPAEARKENWRRPRYEVTAGKEAYELKVFLPGVPKKQAEVTIEKDQLLVTGRRAGVRPENAKIVHEELPNDDYRLQLQLNVNVDAEKIEAQSDAGVLTVKLPLAEESKPRAITVE